MSFSIYDVTVPGDYSCEAIRLPLEQILPIGKEPDCDGNAKEDAPGRRRDEVQHIGLVMEYPSQCVGHCCRTWAL